MPATASISRGEWNRASSAAVEALCFDPQTSGGLLAAIAPEAVGDAERAGFTPIGEVLAGPAGVTLRP